MISAPHKTIVCKCGKDFIPIIGFSGIIQSRSCQQCRYDLEMTRRKAKINTPVARDEKVVKKCPKSKLPTIRKSRTVEETLIAKLDRVFSLFIRYRDSTNGYFKCISCGRIKVYRQADCGHFVNRSYMSTRYDEVNCNAQCRHCNRFKEGNNQGYRRGLLKKYGELAVDQLDIKKSITLKLAPFELKLMIEEYSLKNKLYESHGKQ